MDMHLPTLHVAMLALGDHTTQLAGLEQRCHAADIDAAATDWTQQHLCNHIVFGVAMTALAHCKEYQMVSNMPSDADVMHLQ